jgi:hypothetical protein
MTRRMLQTLAMLFVLTIGLWAADDPFMGTWKLNLAKSNYGSAPTPKSETIKLEPWEDGAKATVDMVTAQGRAIHYELAAKYDGKDYPIKGDPLADTIAVKRTDANHAESTWKKDGKVVSRVQEVISRDGKTWTATIATKDAQGKDIKIVQVSDKQ